MKTQTHIATTLDSLPTGMLRIDQSIKELLADVQILAHILKYTVSELEEVSIEEIISSIDESQIEIGSTPIEPGLTNYGKVQKNVEFFNSDYDSIKKVYSIWICTGTGMKKESINELCFVQRNVFGEEQNLTELDKMNAVIITLRSGVCKAESRHKLISMLEDLLSEKDAKQKKELLEAKHDIKMTTKLERRISNMCNLSEYILDNAIENAIEKERYAAIERMLGNNKTVEEIVEFCGYDKEEVLAIQREVLKNA